MSVAKYWAVFKTAWQNQLEYRTETVLKLLAFTITLVSAYYLWTNVYGDRAVLMGYTREQMVTYYVLVGYLFTAIYAGIPIAEDIQTGELSAYLTRPLSYLWYQYWYSLAKRVMRLLLGLPIVAVILFLLRGHVQLVTDYRAYLALLLTCWGTINIMFLTDALVTMAEFWLPQSWSMSLFFDVLRDLFSGALIPLVFLPPLIRGFSNWLPFRYAVNFIIDAFLGRLSGPTFIWDLGLQTVWTLGLAVLVTVVWRRGLKRYEAFGA